MNTVAQFEIVSHIGVDKIVNRETIIQYENLKELL